MSTEFAIASVEVGKLNALVKNVMRQMRSDDPNEAIRRVNSGEWMVVLVPEQAQHCWHEQDEVIYFSVTSDGTTGSQWIERLESKSFRIGDYAKSVLLSPDFKPTCEVTTEIAILKGMLFTDNDRVTKKIRAEADKRKLTKPNAEIACLIREKFSDEEIEAMDLWWIVAMHEPIKDSVGDPDLLSTSRYDDGRWLHAYYGKPDYRWGRNNGFAFAVSQV